MNAVFPDVIGDRIVATRQEVFFFGTPAGAVQYEAPALPAWVHIGDRFVYGIPAHEGRANDFPRWPARHSWNHASVSTNHHMTGTFSRTGIRISQTCG